MTEFQAAIERITADMRAAQAFGPTPEFLVVLIRQHEVMVRAAARRNDPSPAMVSYETLRDQLAAMKEMLPIQQAKWDVVRAARRKAAAERILARWDAGERKAEIDTINDGFRDCPARPWQDDMSGVGDPDAVGAEA